MKNLNYYNPKNNFPSDSIGKKPNWILKSGISILSGTIILLLLVSVFIEYPDRLSSKIIITTATPPVRIVNPSEGRIKALYVKDRDTVYKNQKLYYIDKNDTDLTHIARLKDILRLGRDTILNYAFNDTVFKLGDIHDSFQDFINHVIKYKEYIDYAPDSIKIKMLKNTLKKHQRLKQIITKKITITDKRLALEKKKVSRQNQLFEKGVISTQEKEISEIAYFEIGEQYQELLREQADIELKILDINLEIENLEIKKENTLKKFEKEFANNMSFLINEISNWESTHIIKAPVKGKTVFLKHDILNANANIGDEQMAIIPLSFDGTIIGKMQSPVYNSGKIKTGNGVNIYLDSYPYQEYGIVSGSVNSIALMANENTYLVRVDLPKGLRTNITEIPFNQELSGTAEIILEKKSLFKRFFEKIFYLKKNEEKQKVI